VIAALLLTSTAAPALLDVGNGGFFTILYAILKSTTGGDVYPGSVADLTIGFQYTGSVNATSVYACVDLPEGFSLRNPCSQPYKPGGDSVSEVEPGSVVEFRYRAAVSRSLTPGVYSGTVNVTYMLEGTPGVLVEFFEFNITVHDYPELSIAVVRNYWVPGGYPGASGVTLAVELENRGESRIASGTAELHTPLGFQPSTLRAQLPSIQPGETATIAFTGITIPLNATPGQYEFTLVVQASLVTSDGIIYSRNTTLVFSAAVEEPPEYSIRVVDYGLTATRPAPGTRYTRLYVTLQSLDYRVVDSGLAVFTLYNAVFANGSSRDVVYFTGPINYGGVFTITTPAIVVLENASSVAANVELNLLVLENNAEYWVEVTLNLLVALDNRSLELYVVDAYWSTGRAYPGSSDIALLVEVLNLMDAALTDVYAELRLPSVTYPDVVYSGPYTVGSGSITRLSFTGISIDPGAVPGNYIVQLTLRGVLSMSDGSFKYVEENHTVVVEVSEPSLNPLSLVYAKWVSGRAYPYMAGTGVEITFTPAAPITVASATYTLIMPPGVYDASTGWCNVTVAIDNPLSYGSYQSIAFSNLKLENATGTLPFAVKARLYVELHGASAWVEQTILFTLPVSTPVLNLSITDVYWAQRVVTGSSKGASLNVLVQSLSTDPVTRFRAVLIPIRGLRAGYGLNYSVTVLETTLSYGDYAAISFQNLEVESDTGSVVFELEIEAVLSASGALYNASLKRVVEVPVTASLEPVKLAGLRVLYAGEPAQLLPTARGAVLEITLLNTLPEPLQSLTASLSTARLETRETAVVCGVVGGGSTCTVSFTVDVESVEPGFYTAVLELSGFVSQAGSLASFTQTLAFNIAVADPALYKPALRVLSSFWGVEVPQYVYPGHRSAPLTVTVMNAGRYTASDLTLYLELGVESVRVLNNGVYCGDVASGSVCSVTFYLDLRNATPGVLSYTVRAEYYVRQYGAFIEYADVLRGSIAVEEPETTISGRSIYVVSANWLNNYPAYPGSKKAVLTLTLANLHPYTTSSIHAVVDSSGVLSEAYPGSLEAYASGPVTPLNTVTLSFTVNVGFVEPGDYAVPVKISYYVQAGGSGYRVEEDLLVVVRVSDPASAVTAYQYGWFTSQPVLGGYGYAYYVMIRNNEVPSMAGAILNITLPRGILSSIDNSTTVSVNPSTILPAQEIQRLAAQPSELYQLIAALAQQPAAVNPVATPGDVLAYTVKLNVLVSEPGVYYANATLDFVDHWGSRYAVNFTIPITVYGNAPVLRIEYSDTVVLVNGTATLKVRVANDWPAAIHNVYAVLSPAFTQLVPVDNVKYVGSVESGSWVEVEYKLVYTPVYTATAMGASALPGNTGVFTLAVIYSDVSGSLSVYNTTIAVIYKPFVDLEISRDTRAEYASGVLKVSGTLVNYGVSRARSVEVVVVYGNASASTFIGDVDPASQVAFRVEVRAASAADDVIRVIVSYRDDYNTVYAKTYTLPVTVAKQQVQSAQSGESVRGGYELLVVLAVALFLAGVFAVIYRFVRAHAKRVEASAIGV